MAAAGQECHQPGGVRRIPTFDQHRAVGADCDRPRTVDQVPKPIAQQTEPLVRLGLDQFGADRQRQHPGVRATGIDGPQILDRDSVDLRDLRHQQFARDVLG